eukprot:3073548-Pyramimonas_sp.AAC.1
MFISSYIYIHLFVVRRDASPRRLHRRYATIPESLCLVVYEYAKKLLLPGGPFVRRVLVMVGCGGHRQ